MQLVLQMMSLATIPALPGLLASHACIPRSFLNDSFGGCSINCAPCFEWKKELTNQFFHLDFGDTSAPSGGAAFLSDTCSCFPKSRDHKTHFLLPLCAMTCKLLRVTGLSQGRCARAGEHQHCLVHTVSVCPRHPLTSSSTGCCFHTPIEMAEKSHPTHLSGISNAHGQSTTHALFRCFSQGHTRFTSNLLV